MTDFTWATAMPLIFMAIMGLSLMTYVVLDGYDLGVGILLPFATDAEKDVMVSSIGPFWDANETWLVLGIGVLLIAFPKAHGVVLSALYLPATIMLIGLALRGVSFDFRVKARDKHKATWNRTFAIGSLVTAMAQGWMLGSYLTGFSNSGWSLAFSAGIMLVFPTAYTMLGAGWLIMKTEGELQRKGGEDDAQPQRTQQRAEQAQRATPHRAGLFFAEVLAVLIRGAEHAHRSTSPSGSRLDMTWR